MNIDLVYLSDNPYGGWMTFTRHLHDSLKMIGATVRCIKVRPHSSNTVRNMGYGLQYHTRSVDDLLAEENKILIVAVQKNQAEAARLIMEFDGHCVVHDHNEVKHFGAALDPSHTVVIRKVNTKLVPGARFILHPYVPAAMQGIAEEKTVHARSVSRIDHDKNTLWLLEANRLLPKKAQIDIRGFENRIYTRFTVMKQFPEWRQSVAAFPREKDAAFNLLWPVKFMVDMSSIKGDGGGSQYTFLEAIDAGAVCILHHTWTAIKGEMVAGKNCIAVESPADLAYKLRCVTDVFRENIRDQARNLLRLHDPKKIAKQYVQFLEGR